MGFRLIKSDYDPFTGITEEFYYNDQTDQIKIRQLADMAPNIKAMKDKLDHFKDAKNGFYKSASIHPFALQMWKKNQGFDWFQSTSNEKKQWLNRSENAHWKTRKGKI